MMSIDTVKKATTQTTTKLQHKQQQIYNINDSNTAKEYES